jgi:hypothetical protein
MLALKTNMAVEWKAQMEDTKKKKNPLHQIYNASAIAVTLS